MKARFETSKHDLVFSGETTTQTLHKDWYPEFFIGQVIVVDGVMELVTKVAVSGSNIVASTSEHTVTYVPSTGVATLAAISG